MTPQPRPLWQQKLLSGGRSGLSGAQLNLAAAYAARLQRGETLAGGDLAAAKAIASCCGTPNRKTSQRVAPWKRSKA